LYHEQRKDLIFERIFERMVERLLVSARANP
jgi:hypothetical protein